MTVRDMMMRRAHFRRFPPRDNDSMIQRMFTFFCFRGPARIRVSRAIWRAARAPFDGSSLVKSAGAALIAMYLFRGLRRTALCFESEKWKFNEKKSGYIGLEEERGISRDAEEEIYSTTSYCPRQRTERRPR